MGHKALDRSISGVGERASFDSDSELAALVENEILGNLQAAIHLLNLTVTACQQHGLIKSFFYGNINRTKIKITMYIQHSNTLDISTCFERRQNLLLRKNGRKNN